MKLQTFSLSLLLLSMFWSQCFSASSCKMANWWGTFDHKGWSTCDSSTEYIKGLWRNDPSGDDEIYLLEEAKCCSAPTPYESMASTCQTANWWGVLDGENVWAVCPTGYFLQGLWRNDGDGWIYKIEEAKCCKPNTLPDQYKDCYNENIWGSFDHKGLSECKADDYYVAGFYKSDCEKIYCIEELKCCRMITDICKYANPCKNGGTCTAVPFGAGYICECPSGYHGNTCELASGK
ncbi:unnamed protein product [Porites lobata]|uniref:EGF-like domain-containing protein n=1 Tax=Porites lobata TaxID=104759 RepID=A0ABN8PXZ8_9CNID|nr:unnamed protein product [Porites lobata]